jgi:hypothetical protein
MRMIYRIKVRGKTLESRDLRKLLARAVAEKRTMDRRLSYFLQPSLSGLANVDGAGYPPELSQH